jgi:hypothetical protein
MILTLFLMSLQKEATAVCIVFQGSNTASTLNGEYINEADAKLNGALYYKKLSCFGAEEIPLSLFFDNIQGGQWRIASSVSTLYIKPAAGDISYEIRCIDDVQPKEPDQCNSWEYTECENSQCTSTTKTLSNNCDQISLPSDNCYSSITFRAFNERECRGEFSSGRTTFYKMNVDYDMYWYKSNKYGGQLICADSYDEETNGCSAIEIWGVLTDDPHHFYSAVTCGENDEPWSISTTTPTTTDGKRRLLEFA